MKKLFDKIIIIFVTLSILSPCQGDANLDASINIQDVILIINHIISDSELVDDAFNNSDTNNDETIDILDIVFIIDSILEGASECTATYLDLSLEWDFSEDLSYFNNEELGDIVNQMSDLSYLDGLIVIHDGKIVSENYYNGSSINETFNIFSVTKSFMSTLIGQAIDMGYFDSQYVTVSNLLPFFTQPYLTQISLHNLLTMSSGYADGFAYPYWVSATTNALQWMPYSFPGFFFYNNSACHLNSHVLYYMTDMTPFEFANINLFPYLGIENPQWLDGYLDINDGSASLELNLRDMIKLGQLYLQDGWSGDEQILSSAWVDQSTSMQIETGSPGVTGYGYLWWLPEDEGFMAIGYAGQHIAVYPDRNLVIGTHSSINNSQDYQTQLFIYIHEYIAPIFESSD